MPNRFMLTALALAACVALGAKPTSCSSLPGTQFGNLAYNRLSSVVSTSSSTMYTGTFTRFTVTTTDEKPTDPFTATQYEWFVDGSLVARTANNMVELSFDAAGQYYIEVEVQGERSYGAITDSAALYITVTSNPSGTTGSTSDTSGATSVTVTISGPETLGYHEAGSYSASASGSSTSVTISWDLLGNGATLGATTGTSTTVTSDGTASGFVSLVAEARDASTGRVLGTATKSISVSAGYRIYLCPQICTNGQLEVRREDDVAAGIALCSLDGGGNDCSVTAVFNPVSEVFATADEAVDWLCPNLSGTYHHYWAGYIATFDGLERCLGNVGSYGATSCGTSN